MPIPKGEELHLRHSSELEIGDLVYITFSFNHLAYWKFGSEEILRVVEKTRDGRLRMVAEDGTVIPELKNPPIGGTKEEMLNELRSLSNFNEVRVFRPFRSGPRPPQERTTSQPVGEAPSIFPTVPVVFSAAAVGLAYYISKKKDENR